jgi:hypothetical protein
MGISGLLRRARYVAFGVVIPRGLLRLSAASPLHVPYNWERSAGSGEASLRALGRGDWEIGQPCVPFSVFTSSNPNAAWTNMLTPFSKASSSMSKRGWWFE